jgi:hypothetical protein
MIRRASVFVFHLLLFVASGLAPTIATATEARAAPPMPGSRQVDDYLTLASVATEEASPSPLSPAEERRLSESAPASPSSFGDVVGVIAGVARGVSLAMLGNKIWDVIVAGKPVANVSSFRVSVLPLAEGDRARLANWQGPAIRRYSVVAKNLLGMSVVKLDYQLVYSYRGQVGGKGAYLANATFIPTSVDVLWGYALNARVEATNAVNSGTEDFPVPMLEIQFIYAIDSLLTHSSRWDSFLLKGSGEARHVTGP